GAARGKLAHRENAGHDPERAVIFAGVDHGIDMRTNQQALFLVRPPMPAQGAKRVLAHGHAGLSHPACDQVGRTAMLGTEIQPDQPLRFGGNRPQFRQHRLGARAERYDVGRALLSHRQWALSQRPSCARSSSVMLVWLPSGIALLRTVWIMMS